MLNDSIELSKAIKIRTAMEEYQDTLYLSMIRNINSECQDILSVDLGNEFVKNCGRDLAGEVVRNCFNTSEFNITVDQLAERILKFSYEDEYDPLNENGNSDQIRKQVYNYNELSSPELKDIVSMMDENQAPLFTEDRKQDKLDRKGKSNYRESKKDINGDVYDELTGEKGDKTTYISKNGKVAEKSTLQADHVQAREYASINSRYVKENGRQELREFWNSSDNMQMMFQSANSSKGDVRVCLVDGKIQYVSARSKEYNPDTDITSRATPEQLADAAIAMWEKVDTNREQQNQPKIKNLQEKGYLDENGKVPKAVRLQLIKNIRHSQNVESVIILKNTDYKQVGKDAFSYTKASIGKIIAGQVIYYTAPPLVYELKGILKNKVTSVEDAIEKLSKSARRIGDYVLSKLKDIFINIAYNSLKKFIKSFMDILINLVKATVKKILKMAKNLVLSTVDAVRIIANPDSSASEKANSVVNLFAVTITTCVIEVMFEVLGETLHIPEPFDDIVFGPLQILTTVICTNLTMLILKKADLFDVETGLKVSKIRKLFEESRQEYVEKCDISSAYADEVAAKLIEEAKVQSKEIYDRIIEFDPYRISVRPELEKINSMFSMNIEFENEWLKFIGVSA